jgi:epoxyqueuosine reductase
LLKEAICRAALEAGFVRARILAPFEPPAGRPAIAANYRQGAPSLLVTALPYGNQGQAATPEPGFALIAPFARRNYYREAVKRLQGLGAAFRSQYGGKKTDYRILCNSPVPEKPLALACGLGAPGRNSLVITPEAGSLVILAGMTLPFALDPDTPLTGPPGAALSAAASTTTSPEPFPFCGGCNRDHPPCVSACPTGAVRGDGTLNLERCMQWYASGKGETVPEKVARHWGRRLYGCTWCQDACVHNQRPIPGAMTGEGTLPAIFDCEELLSLPDETLKARFQGTALGLSWLGPKAIRRNARMALRWIAESTTPR